MLPQLLRMNTGALSPPGDGRGEADLLRRVGEVACLVLCRGGRADTGGHQRDTVHPAEQEIRVEPSALFLFNNELSNHKIIGMIFETQSTQRTNPMKERFQEEAKASSQSCGLAQGLPLHTVFFFAQPLCAVPWHLLKKLCVLNNTLRTLCLQHCSVSSVFSVLKKIPTYL